MLRLRRPPLAARLRAVALIAILAAPMPEAMAQSTLAQSTDDTDRLLMRPVVDGDPRNPPRFRAPTVPKQDSSTSRIGEVPSFQYRSAVGAGTTGFDSVNARRRKAKSVPKAKAGSAGSAGGAGMAGATSGSAGPLGAPLPGAAAEAQPGQTASASSTSPSATPAAATSRQNLVIRPTTPATAFATNAAGTAIGAPVAVLLRGRPLPEEDPFAPTGIQVGAFTLRPALEMTGAYDTNPARTASASPPITPSWYAVMAPELLINSNWARHELTANLRGSLTSYDETKDLNRPDADLKVNGRIDVTTTTRVDLEARYLVATDNPGSPNIQANLLRLPIYTTLGGTAGLTQRFNRFEVTGKGGVDRTHYQNSHFDDGSISSNEDRQYIRYNAALRLAYELTPGAKPFTEVAVDQRTYDLAVDAGGVNRDSKGLSAKAGTTFEYSRILTGEVAVGYLARHYNDPALQSFSGLLVDGSLVWLASALTTFKFTAATSVSESTVSGVSGVFTRDFSWQIDHAFRRWLIATGKFTFGIDDYEGSPRLDKRYMASALLTYKLTRELWLKAEYRHLWLNSSESANNYTADVFLLGMRLQR